MSTIYHSAFGGDLVFEDNSLEHADQYGVKKQAEITAENMAKELVKEYISTVRDVNDEFQQALEKHLQSLADNPQKLVDEINRRGQATIRIVADHFVSGGGSGTAAIKVYRLPERLKRK